MFETRVGDKQIEGCDFIQLDEDGAISEFTVMVRPMSGMLALAEAMKAQLTQCSSSGNWSDHLTSGLSAGTLGRMALQPVNRRSVPEDVFEQIVAEVLSGEMQPGEALPSERRLAEVLGVSRPAVREALKRLTAAGLVEVRQGDATTVRDFRRHAGLDLLPRLLVRAGELDLVGRAQHPRDPAAQRAQGRRAGGPAAAPGTGCAAR